MGACWGDRVGLKPYRVTGLVGAHRGASRRGGGAGAGSGFGVWLRWIERGARGWPRGWGRCASGLLLFNLGHAWGNPKRILPSGCLQQKAAALQAGSDPC